MHRLPDFKEGQHPRDAFGKFAQVATGDRAGKLRALQQAHLRRRKMTADTIELARRQGGPATLVAPKGHSIRQSADDVLRRDPSARGDLLDRSQGRKAEDALSSQSRFNAHEGIKSDITSRSTSGPAKRRIQKGDRVTQPHPISGRIMTGTVHQTPIDDRQVGVRWDDRSHTTDWHGRASLTLSEEPTTKASRGRIGPRAGQEGQPGKPAAEFLKEHPPVTSAQRTLIGQAAQDSGWQNNTDAANIEDRKRDRFTKGEWRITVEYSDAGTISSAALRHGTKTLQSVFNGSKDRRKRALALFGVGDNAPVTKSSGPEPYEQTDMGRMIVSRIAELEQSVDSDAPKQIERLKKALAFANRKRQLPPVVSQDELVKAMQEGRFIYHKGKAVYKDPATGSWKRIT